MNVDKKLVLKSVKQFISENKDIGSKGFAKLLKDEFEFDSYKVFLKQQNDDFVCQQVLNIEIDILEQIAKDVFSAEKMLQNENLE